VLDIQSAPAPIVGRKGLRPEPPLQKGPLQTRKTASLTLGPQPRKSGARRKSAFDRPSTQIVFVSTQSPEARHAKFGMARCPATHKVQRWDVECFWSRKIHRRYDFERSRRA
jgi:hypothetical protein